ncbi:MAG: 2'-deoxycytidine 5'-triphosphate deaminase [Planctomycetota bacterium]
MAVPEHTGRNGHILVDRDLRALLGGALRVAPGAPPIRPEQVEPASIDLRLGEVAHRVRAGFLPAHTSIEERLESLSTQSLPLEGDGAVLERGLIYLVPLEEELDLPADVHGRFNPRSSTGRCDVFTRMLVPGHDRFDETPRGYSGRLWLEVAPLSFPIRLRRGDRLSQLRLQRGVAALTTEELRERYARTPLCFEGERPIPVERMRFDDDGALLLRIGLKGRDPCGWTAALHTEVVDFGAVGAHARQDFWTPVRAKDGHCILAPGAFSIFASKEAIRIPPDLAAEMLPIDVGIGELRNNYAGFFDNGFGWDEAREGGTPAVLEVRVHDLPFLVEDGQVFFRLRFFRTNGVPERVYGEGRRGPSYRGQGLTLARAFRVE